MTDIEPIAVEVAFALPDKQKIIELMVDPGTSAYDTVLKSRINEQFPELNIEDAKMGIFGQAIKAPKDHILHEGDRVEIYRPLIADPKEVRRKRAEKAKAEKAKA